MIDPVIPCPLCKTPLDIEEHATGVLAVCTHGDCLSDNFETRIFEHRPALFAALDRVLDPSALGITVNPDGLTVITLPHGIEAATLSELSAQVGGTAAVLQAAFSNLARLENRAAKGDKLAANALRALSASEVPGVSHYLTQPQPTAPGSLVLAIAPDPPASDAAPVEEPASRASPFAALTAPPRLGG